MAPKSKEDKNGKPRNEGFVLFREKISAYKAMMGIVEVNGAVPKIRLHRPKDTGDGFYEVRGQKVMARDLLAI